MITSHYAGMWTSATMSKEIAHGPISVALSVPQESPTVIEARVSMTFAGTFRTGDILDFTFTVNEDTSLWEDVNHKISLQVHQRSESQLLGYYRSHCDGFSDAGDFQVQRVYTERDETISTASPFGQELDRYTQKTDHFKTRHLVDAAQHSLHTIWRWLHHPHQQPETPSQNHNHSCYLSRSKVTLPNRVNPPSASASNTDQDTSSSSSSSSSYTDATHPSR